MKLKILKEIINKKENKSEFAIITNLETGNSEIFEPNITIGKDFEKYRDKINDFYKNKKTGVINDTNMAVRDSMERWMNGINSHTTNTGRADPLEYESDLLVDQLDKSGGIIKQYVFRGCFPTVVSPIDLSYTAENEIERFSVEFQIQYWESNTTT